MGAKVRKKKMLPGPPVITITGHNYNATTQTLTVSGTMSPDPTTDPTDTLSGSVIDPPNPQTFSPTPAPTPAGNWNMTFKNVPPGQVMVSVTMNCSTGGACDNQSFPVP